MHRVIILSDSHGRSKTFEKICSLHPEAERYLFLGDGAGDYESVQTGHPDWAMMGVCGNCDRGTNLPEINEYVVEDWRIMLTHGHLFAVRGTDHYILEEAKKRGCNAVLYGHTHSARCEKVDGIWLLNPGAVMDYRCPRYAVLDLDRDGKFIANLTELSYTR